MKRTLCLIFTLIMTFVFVSSAMAASFSTRSLNQGTGVDADKGPVTKTTNLGVAATGTAGSATTTSAIFQGTVRKMDGVNASTPARFTKGASFKMKSLQDGYGNDLLRPGSSYSYKLRVAHRSNSPVTEARASGTWQP